MLNGIKKGCQTYIDESRRLPQTSNILDNIDITFWEDTPIFCPYQVKMVTDNSPVSIIEKGRQIGFSWTMSFRAVMCAVSGEKDTIVNSYNKDAIKNFLKDAGEWAKIFNVIFEHISYEKVIDNRNVNVFELKFNNGRRIIGLPGTPTSFRSFTNCHIIIDEAAYREQPLDDYLGAAMATLIHGGTVRIGSTHCGTDNDFNILIEKVKKKQLPYKLHTYKFKDAVNDGLYKRICKKKSEIWTQAKQDAWMQEIYEQYGTRASEELDAVPTDYSEGGKIFNCFKLTSLQGYEPSDYIRMRYHDLAASEDKEDENDAACFSASVAITYILSERKLVIDDWTAVKVSPLDGDDLIEELAIEDGSKCIQLIEQEPGSTGLKYVAYMQERLSKKGLFLVEGYQPRIKKVKRAIPAGQAMVNGELMLWENLPDIDDFKRLIYKFSNKPQPLVTDLGDCVSGLYDYVKNNYNWVI